ncbi:MAG: regulatory protein RecX [Gemmatimonadaceae bacterium]
MIELTGEDLELDRAPTRAVRIIDIVEHPRRAGRYLLTLSDERTFTLSVSLLANLGVTRKGTELDAQTVRKLENETEVLGVMDRAIASLSRGRRTRRELEQRLRRVRPGVLPPAVAVVAIALDRLTETGLISDEAVARAEASSRLRRGDAPKRVEMILQRKGIERRAAADAVSEAVAEDAIDVDAQCVAVAAKRMRSLAKLETKVARRRLMAFLMRRGYGFSSIQLAVTELFASR